MRPTSEFRSRRGARPALQGKDFQTTHVSPVAPKCPGGSQARLRPRRHRAAPRACLPVPGRHGGSRCPAGRRGLGAPDQPVPGRRAWGLELSLSAEPDPLGCWQPATRRKPTCRKRAAELPEASGQAAWALRTLTAPGLVPAAAQSRPARAPRLLAPPPQPQRFFPWPRSASVRPVLPANQSPTESYYVRPGSGGRKSPQSQRGESRQGAAGGSACGAQRLPSRPGPASRGRRASSAARQLGARGSPLAAGGRPLLTPGSGVSANRRAGPTATLPARPSTWREVPSRAVFFRKRP